MKDRKIRIDWQRDCMPTAATMVQVTIISPFEDRVALRLRKEAPDFILFLLVMIEKVV